MQREIKPFDMKMLRRKSLPLQEIDDGVRTLIDDMYETVKGKGIGLSAIQVGEPVQVVVIDLNEQQLALINPVLRAQSLERSKQIEGCLSLPGVTRPVKRSVEILVDYRSPDGLLQHLHAHDILARVVLHELDHLKGKLITDYSGV